MTDEIPDFISGDSQTKSSPLFKMAKKADLLSSIYESEYWYQFSLGAAAERRAVRQLERRLYCT